MFGNDSVIALLRNRAREDDLLDEVRAERLCTLGVGCGISGKCYAKEMGDISMCGKVQSVRDVYVLLNTDGEGNDATPIAVGYTKYDLDVLERVFDRYSKYSPYVETYSSNDSLETMVLDYKKFHMFGDKDPIKVLGALVSNSWVELLVFRDTEKFFEMVDDVIKG